MKLGTTLKLLLPPSAAAGVGKGEDGSPTMVDDDVEDVQSEARIRCGFTKLLAYRPRLPLKHHQHRLTCIGNESMPRIIINNTIFSKLQSAFC